MFAFTTCTNEGMEGNLINWNRSDLIWNDTFSAELEELCLEKAPGIKVLPIELEFEESVNLCSVLKSEIYTYQASLNETNLETIVDDNNFKAMTPFWTGYTDEASSGIFLSQNGKLFFEDKDSSLDWVWGEPNGGSIQNCTAFRNRFTNLVSDVSCKSEAYPSCQFLSRPKFQFRGEQNLGLDPLEIFVLKMEEDMSPEEYHMKSFFGTTLTMRADPTGGPSWELISNSKTIAIQNSSSYFGIGTHTWNDIENNETITLNLNACHEDEFSCADGNCVNKWNRCDQTYNCADESDELKCEYVILPSTYNKLLPPRNTNGKTPIRIELVLRELLSINILKETFKLKFSFRSLWTDKRLEYTNLQQQNVNILEPEDWNDMWVPNFLFDNTQNSLTTFDMTNEKDSSVNVILQNPDGIPDDKSRLVKNFYYLGSDVIISKLNVYTVDFNCNLKWINYPFDIQTCPMQIRISTSKPELVNFNVTSIMYANNYSNYKIHQGNISFVTNVQNETIIEVPLILVRDIKSIILNTYMPTFILTLINQLTNYHIGYEMFEAVITINATTLLTLTSLFISVFDSLPKTTEIKLIDIWMLTTFVYPFIIIVIHTLVHINSRNQSKQARRFERGLMAFGKVGLPLLFAVFTVVYAINGAQLLTQNSALM